MDISLTSLHQVALCTADVERSSSFYRDRLGAELIAKFDPPGLVFFRLGETRLLLEHSDAPHTGGATLYFHVPDIQAAHRTLCERGVEFDSEPHLIHRDDRGDFGAAGVEEWMAFFRDPDGNVLAIASRVPPS